MPDSLRQSVSASQAPALFGMSPYLTRWMLFQAFANGMPIEPDDNIRMAAGRRFEAAILVWAADEMRVDILPHPQTEYLRHPDFPLGCTPDGYVLDPQRGLGFIEAKNVDWLRWRDTWTDTEATAAIEIQHQVQLMTPHPEYGIPQWGEIACCVGGNELKLYPRVPLPAVQASIGREAIAFLASVKAKQEPDIAGSPLELPGLHWAIPSIDPSLHLTEDSFDDPVKAVELARWIEESEMVKLNLKHSKKRNDELQVLIEARVGNAQSAVVYGREVKFSRSQIAGRVQEVKPYVMVKMTPKTLNYARPLDDIAPPDAAFGLPKDVLI